MRSRTAVLAGIALAATIAAPASARPDSFEEPIFAVFPDVDNGLVVFWNIGREDYVPWATGSARATSTDNDVFHFETVGGVIRGQSFGEQGNGAVVDPTGATHRYSWGFRAVNDPQGAYRERTRTELTP